METKTAVPIKNAHPRWREFTFSAKRFLRNPLSVIGLSLLVVFGVVALLAPVLAPPKYPDPYRIPHTGWQIEPSPPSVTHPLGTTEQQYDLLYGLIWGSRSAFKIGVLVVGANLLIGILLGAIAGYFGGLIDEVLMRITDIFYAIPFLVMAMALVIALGRGLKSIIIVLIILEWPSYTRVLRSDILVLRERDFIQAARASGASHFSIIMRHVLPNAMYSVLILASMNIGVTIISAAALSFLGLGSPTGYADWGQIVSMGRNWIVGSPGNRFAYWYTVFIPGFVISLFVLGWNLLGDAVRDVFDPKLRRR
ncbi:MAG: ABC transporter permease [Spirochaetia bacterium]|jgi:peptide/nickel transport system permease protein